LRCGINKGLIKRGKHNRSLNVAVQGLDFIAYPLIHTYKQHSADYWVRGGGLKITQIIKKSK
jgi:hypothetical protein